ncbi:MAG: porin family protein [Acidobacteria bacterium]|nr:porin family protein [Acidobacteriota bacterium]
MSLHSKWFAALVLAGAVTAPVDVLAQAFGIGPRLSFVRSEVGSSGPATRLVGGTLRLRSSRHVALEAALDYRADYTADRTSRVRQSPLQVSLLLFPIRSTISPYLLAGMGLYTEHADSLNPAGAVLETTMTRKTGSHLGVGAELLLARHAALFVDYRLRFVKFGTAEPDAEPIDIPGLRSLELSHRGTMWTSGMAFYF